jgi:hypothetical protein
MLQRDGVVMTAMKVLVMMVVMMMISMKPSLMMVTMAMISPSGKEFPSQIFACRRAFSLYVFSAPQIWQSRSMIRLLVLGLGLGLARPRGWCGTLVAHLALSFWLLPSSGEI